MCLSVPFLGGTTRGLLICALLFSELPYNSKDAFDIALGRRMFPGLFVRQFVPLRCPLFWSLQPPQPEQPPVLSARRAIQPTLCPRTKKLLAPLEVASFCCRPLFALACVGFLGNFD